MTNKERVFILAQIEKFDQWATQFRDSAYTTSDDPDEDEFQARLCENSASVLRGLLIDLDEL